MQIPISAVPKREDQIKVLALHAAELERLSKGISVFHAGLGTYVDVRGTMSGLSADKPQKSDDLCVLRTTSTAMPNPTTLVHARRKISFGVQGAPRTSAYYKVFVASAQEVGWERRETATRCDATRKSEFA